MSPFVFYALPTGLVCLPVGYGVARLVDRYRSRKEHRELVARLEAITGPLPVNPPDPGPIPDDILALCFRDEDD